jgi:nitric oxide dioxygenase
MTPDQKQLVQSTWEKVLPIADAAAAPFYGRLFELDPEGLGCTPVTC